MTNFKEFTYLAEEHIIYFTVISEPNPNLDPKLFTDPDGQIFGIRRDPDPQRWEKALLISLLRL
jgi:hypothetical protein